MGIDNASRRRSASVDGKEVLANGSLRDSGAGERSGRQDRSRAGEVQGGMEDRPSLSPLPSCLAKSLVSSQPSLTVSFSLSGTSWLSSWPTLTLSAVGVSRAEELEEEEGAWARREDWWRSSSLARRARWEATRGLGVSIVVFIL